MHHVVTSRNTYTHATTRITLHAQTTHVARIDNTPPYPLGADVVTMDNSASVLPNSS
jgi:hypothetical protein